MWRTEVRESLRRYAEGHYPDECCGVLLGREEKVERFLPARNTVAERRRDRYELHPSDLLAAEKTAEREGLEVIGFFHSHPDHPAIPSEFDRTHAWADYTYAIGEVRDGALIALRTWRLESGSFREIVQEEEIHAKG